MSIVRLDHVSLLANNPEPVVDFYRRLLGFELIRSREFPEMGMVIFDLKTRNEYLEVIQPTGSSPKSTDGIKHLAFLSDDIDEDFSRFKGEGVSLIHTEVQRHGDVAFFFLRGSAGEYVEIIQYLGR